MTLMGSLIFGTPETNINNSNYIYTIKPLAIIQDLNRWWEYKCNALCPVKSRTFFCRGSSKGSVFLAFNVSLNQQQRVDIVKWCHRLEKRPSIYNIYRYIRSKRHSFAEIISVIYRRATGYKFYHIHPRDATPEVMWRKILAHKDWEITLIYPNLYTYKPYGETHYG